MNMHPEISVIIPTYNEEKVIADCLKSLGNLATKNFEVIIVDDGSTDQTISILNSFCKQMRLVILKQQHKGPGAARNLGAGHAKGKILVFVDADMSFDKHFLESLTEPIRKGITKGSFSKEEYVANWDNVWSRCWNINEGWELKRRHPKNYPDKQKVFRAILKSEFERVGGFTPGGYTDDYSLSEKLGYEAVAASDAVFYHANPESLEEIYKQAKWAAKRRYKKGNAGYLAAILRASPPVSVFIGLYKAVIKAEPEFIVFKIVYDLGTESGIFEYLITGKASK